MAAFVLLNQRVGLEENRPRPLPPWSVKRGRQLDKEILHDGCIHAFTPVPYARTKKLGSCQSRS